MSPVTRDRADRCPGVLRPWIADDGALIRLRLVGGELDAGALRRLASVAEAFGDGNLHLTSRANLQIRGIAHTGGRLSAELVEAVREAGLLPSPTHERVRNILVSPLTGLASGRANLRPAAAELDRLLCADPELAGLPGKFLFCLDDGRGDVSADRFDLGLFALDASHAQVRIGTAHRGPVIPLSEAPAALLAFARKFLRIRGNGDAAAWHVDELPQTGRELLDAPPFSEPRPDFVAPTPFLGESGLDARSPETADGLPETPFAHPPRAHDIIPVPLFDRSTEPYPRTPKAEGRLPETPFTRLPRTHVAPVPPFGGIGQDDGRQAGHFAVPGGLLSAREAVRLASLGSRIIVTPWRSIIIPDISASELL